MKYSILSMVAIVLVILVWPPVFFLYFARDLQTWVNGHGRMADFELQQLLSAQRWIVDIPEDKDGWTLELETESDGTVRTSGGSSVAGGSRIVLLTRRDSSSKSIEYAWYSTKSTHSIQKNGPVTITMNLTSSGTGTVDDPLASARVTLGRPDGIVQIGEPIYRGGRSSVPGFPSAQPADYEVRVVLTPPSIQAGAEQ